MPTHPASPRTEQADLERLAAELATLGYRAQLITPAGRLPHLDVRNPRASVLTERVYTQAGSYWFGWGERIAGTDQVTTAAATLARVLRTIDGQ
jgi:hypothetical protein